MPIMAVLSVTRSASCLASASQSFSASGKLIEILLEHELRGDRVHRQLVPAPAQAAFSLHGRIALIDLCDRQPEAALKAARKALGLPSDEMRFALRGERPPDDEARRLPFLHQLFYRRKARIARSSYCRQRMRGAQLGFPDCHADAL